MTKAHWIARIDVSALEQHDRPVADAAAPLTRRGTCFLVRAGRFEVPEGVSRGHNVAIKFPGDRMALDCCPLPEHQQVMQLRLPAAQDELIFVEDCEYPQPGASAG